MTNLISRKIKSVALGNVAAMLLASAGIFSFIHGASVINANSLLGVTLVSLLPLFLYAASYFYQGMVVGNCRQLAIIDTINCGHFKKSLILSLKDAFESTRYVPMLLTLMTLLTSIFLVSPAIGEAIIDSEVIFSQCLFSLVISGNLIVATKAGLTTIDAYKNVCCN